MRKRTFRNPIYYASGHYEIYHSDKENLGATSRASSSDLCHYFQGQLVSHFTVALIKQDACSVGEGLLLIHLN